MDDPSVKIFCSQILRQTSWRNARKYNILLTFVFKHLTLSRQYTTLCGREQKGQLRTLALWFIALCCSRGVRKRSLCVRLLGKRNPGETTYLSETTAWNGSYDNGPLPLSVGRNRVKSVTMRRLASLFADPRSRRRHFLFKQNWIAKNFLFGKSYGMITFGKSYNDCDRHYEDI